MLTEILDAIDALFPGASRRDSLRLAAVLGPLVVFGTIAGVAAFVRLACQAIKGDYAPDE